MKNLNEKSYNTVLTETSDFFAAQGISIIGEGYKEIATSPVLFESYVDQLTEGCSADSAAVMAQLMANTNTSILRESSTTGIQPVASLSMPVIRKLWPKFALKDALKTEVAKTPRFVISYTAPYMFRADAEGNEERVYLPKGIASSTYDVPSALRKSVTERHTIELAAGAASSIDFAFKNGVDGDKDPAVVIANTPSAVKVQPLDELFFEAAVYVKTADKAFVAGKTYYKADDHSVINDGNSGTWTTDALEREAVKIGKRLGVYGNAVYPFAGGQLIVQFDGANHTALFAAIGGAVHIEAYAAVSSEYNEDSWSVGLDIKRQDIDIPTGKHLNAPLPIEALNDMMALYQIDGTKETVDLMTNVFAQQLDKEVLDFLSKSWLNQPGNEAFQRDGYPGATEYYLTFDCKPAAGFAGSPKFWREEIRPMIDFMAQKIKNQTYLQSGMFNIVCNPLDAQILANVDWQFRGGQGGNMDGVDADYSVGTYVGANSYKVIASVNVPAGKMFVVFIPSGDTQMTYKYYPYSFSTELGYVDSNRSRTPSIMMTKRHTFNEFIPAIGVIGILHNDGQSYFAEYQNWHQVTDDGTGVAGYDGRLTDYTPGL